MERGGDARQAQLLMNWANAVTRNLAAEARKRVISEVQATLESAVAAARMQGTATPRAWDDALEALGSPDAARKQYEAGVFTASEESIISGATEFGSMNVLCIAFGLICLSEASLLVNVSGFILIMLQIYKKYILVKSSRTNILLPTIHSLSILLLMFLYYLLKDGYIKYAILILGLMGMFSVLKTYRKAMRLQQIVE